MDNNHYNNNRNNNHRPPYAGSRQRYEHQGQPERIPLNQTGSASDTLVINVKEIFMAGWKKGFMDSNKNTIMPRTEEAEVAFDRWLSLLSSTNPTFVLE